MTLVSLYGSYDDKPGFFHIMQGMIEEINNVHCSLCGDWNLFKIHKLILLITFI